MNIPAFYRHLNIFKHYIYQIVNVRYTSITDIVGYAGANGEKMVIDSYYDYGLQATAQREPVTYIYSTTQAKSTHNGVTIISDTVPWDGTQATLADFHDKVGETNPSGNGCWVMKFEGYLTAFMGGAVGGGSTADTKAIKSCISALSSRTYGGVLRLEDLHKVDDTLEISTNSVTIVGIGWGAGLTRSGDYGDTIYLHGDSATGTQLRYTCVSNLKITTTGLMSSGGHIHCEGVNRSFFNDIFMQDGFIGWKLNGLTASYINDIYLVFTNNYTGTRTGRRYMEFGNATGSYSHPSCGDLFINGFNIRGSTVDQTLIEYGLNIISADGIWFSDGHIGNAYQANINIDNAGSTELLNLLFFDNVMSDEGTNYSLYFGGDATVFFREMSFNGCHFKGGPGCSYGIATSANTRAYEISFEGCHVTGFQEEGVYIQAPNFRNIAFNNTEVYGNGRNGATNAAGYRFAANVKDISISGGRSGGGTGSAADAGTQSYGIEFASGHTGILLDNVDLSTNLTAAYNSIPSGVSLLNCQTGSGVITVTESGITFDTSGRIGVGGTPLAANITQFKDITGATTWHGCRQQGTVKSDVTVIGTGYSNVLLTDAAAFTLAQYMHFRAEQSTIGAGSAITSQMGFSVASSLTGATNNYGFYGNLAAASNVWNFYAAGTARNFMAGRLDVGGTARTATVAPSVTNPVSFYSSDTTVTDGATAAAGTVAHVPVNAFNNPALAATNAGITYTNASTIYIDGAPTAGSNVTITNPYSLYINSGKALFNDSLTVFGGTAIPAGGTAGAGYKLSSTANFGVFFGSGAPTLSAAQGSLYLRSDGTGTSDRAYINVDGGTTWTSLTTAA